VKRLVAVAAMSIAALVAWGPASTASSASAPPGRASHAVSAAPHVNHHPMVRPSGVQPHTIGPTTVSLNWSGYAATSSSKFNYVHSTFVQPKAICDGGTFQWSSDWVGLDGFNNGTVEQDGTFMNCGGPDHTVPRYYAWYEMYPEGSVNVFRVNPGDVIDAAVRYSSGTFELTVQDLSTGKSATHDATCSACGRTSAEWIVERPALCSSTSCFITALAHFTPTTLTDNIARLVGESQARGITQLHSYPIDMVDPVKGGGFISLDSTGSVDPSTQSFPVTWDRHGNIFPL
jgi:hypothetical protein